MPNYIVNKKQQETGEHEVHTTDCSYQPAADAQDSLGWFSSCQEAVEVAKKNYANVDGCFYCCNPCHRR